MLMADVLQWVAVALGFVVSLPALWMLARAIGPRWFEKRAGIEGLGKSLLVGLAPLLVAVIVLAAMGKRLGPLPGAWVSGLVVLWGLAGAAGIAAQVGVRLWPAADPWRQSRNGGLVLVCVALLPMVGWFIVFPLLLVAGMGTQVRAWFVRKPTVTEAPVSVGGPPPVVTAGPPPVPPGA